MKYFCDLHIHSALSPCGDNDMTPNNIVNMAVLCGLNIIAVADHNSIGNAAAAMKVAENLPITVVPGMELETSEEAHFVCLFPTLKDAEGFYGWLEQRCLPIKNKPEIFGEQLYLNENDEQVGTEERLLVTAASCSIYEAAPVVRSFGAAIFPAHVDKSAYSIISNLGTVPKDLGFTTVELSKNMSKERALEAFPYLSEYRIITNSDSHYLDTFYETQNPIELEEPTATALIKKLSAHV